MTDTDLLIVGGGPAGMVVGLFARARVRKIVLEKHGDFLRDFRGDTVHPSTLDLFDELGLLDAILFSQKGEIALTGREPSQTPADASKKLSGLNVPDEDKPALSTAGHFALGSALGLGLAGMAGVPEPVRSGLFFGGAWGVGNRLTAALGVAEPLTQWSAKQLATDLGHHVIYALAAGLAFARLRRFAKV